jgi:hypothetical protein
LPKHWSASCYRRSKKISHHQHSSMASRKNTPQQPP